MIKITKKLLYKPKDYRFPSLEKSPFLKVTIFSICFFFLYILLPIYFVFYLKVIPPVVLFLFYLVNLIILFYLFKKNSRQKYQFKFRTQDLQEKINILNNRNPQDIKNNIALQEKIKRYNSLRSIIEEINQNLNLESIANSLSEIVFSLIAKNKGTCILYLVEYKTAVSLSLFKAKKEDKRLIIKAKEGDVFDLWVLKHTSPLIIEDIKKDFRFDLEKLKTQDAREFSSLISSPLISEQRFLGILRLDNPQPHFYTQDDLRLLVAISDLGAVALENGEYFAKTQDLAIHDGLTSLYTKGYFLERLKEECKRRLRDGGTLSLLMLDIDDFKNYNDRFGHTAGDIVLKNLSLNIVEYLKDLHPVVSRFGGEEFCIILPHIDKEKALLTAERLRARIEKTKIVLRRHQTQVTVSIGVATLPVDTNDENELILKADQAMYAAKQKGKNQVCGI